MTDELYHLSHKKLANRAVSTANDVLVISRTEKLKKIGKEILRREGAMTVKDKSVIEFEIKDYIDGHADIDIEKLTDAREKFVAAVAQKFVKALSLEQEVAI